MATATVNPDVRIPFLFDEESHTCLDASSKRRILTVTQVLESCGISDFAGAPLAAMERKRVIGSTAHSAAHVLMTKDELNWEAIEARGSDAIPYILAVEDFLENVGFTPELVEERQCVRLPQGPVSFQTDGIGKLSGQYPAILDWKCGDKEQVSWRVQLAGYEQCVLALGLKPVGAPVYKQIAVHLRPGMKPPWKMLTYDSVTESRVHKQVWQSCLFLATWKQNNQYTNL